MIPNRSEPYEIHHMMNHTRMRYLLSIGPQILCKLLCYDGSKEGSQCRLASRKRQVLVATTFFTCHLPLAT